MKDILLIKRTGATIASCILTINALLCLAQERAYRQFNTQSVRQVTQNQYPEYIENSRKIEKIVSDFSSVSDDNQIYKIPIIFHILTTDEQPMPDLEQVTYQVEVLNKCFGSYEPKNDPYTNESIEKFAKLGVSPNIEFYIPSSFEGAKGFNVVKTTRKKFGIANEMQNPLSGGIAPVNPKNP